MVSFYALDLESLSVVVIGGLISTGWSWEKLSQTSIAHLSYISFMSRDSPDVASGTRRLTNLDASDEVDANIRNFAPVARIMKNALPDNAKIAKEAKECMQECVSEFISFITSEGKSWTISEMLSGKIFIPYLRSRTDQLFLSVS